jgi:hypothetical protein
MAVNCEMCRYWNRVNTRIGVGNALRTQGSPCVVSREIQSGAKTETRVEPGTNYSLNRTPPDISA